MRNQKISVNLSKYLTSSAQSYLIFVTVAFTVTGVICAGLFLGWFGGLDRVNAYIMGTELFHSMIRTASAATMMTLLIDFLSRRYEGDDE